MVFGSNASFSAEVRVGSLSPVHLWFRSEVSPVLMVVFSLRGGMSRVWGLDKLRAS